MQSRHAQTLKSYDGTGFAGKTLRERGGITYSFNERGVTLSNANESRFVAIDWLFGAGHFARTPLFKDGNDWVEHRLTWYASTQKLSLSPGHPLTPATDLDEALGVRQSANNASRCFACHQTGNRPGVHCENCHGPQGNHPQRLAIRKDASVAACANCHRSPAREYRSPTPEIEDPMSIRFAPVGLLVSKCYLRSAGKLTCTTCHNPHTPLAASATYDPVCTNCHATKPAACKPDCASCHMPKSSPVPLLTFTDHRIRK